MLLDHFYKETSKLLQEKFVDSYEIETRIIISYVLKMDLKEFILYKDSKEISTRDQKKVLKLIKRRLKGRGIFTLTEKKEFYGENFFVNRDVLIPRHETELIIDQILLYFDPSNIYTILELGTGSGVLAITLSQKYSGSVVTAIDISSKALKVAKINLKKHSIDRNKIKLLKYDMFKFKSADKFDIILSNPPYIKTREAKSLLKNKVIDDPLVALDGGVDGLHYYRGLKKIADNYLRDSGMAFFEFGLGQKDDIKTIFGSNYTTSFIKDYSNIDRIVCIKKAM